jgi:hypothetical protein
LLAVSLLLRLPICLLWLTITLLGSLLLLSRRVDSYVVMRSVGAVGLLVRIREVRHAA